MDNFEYNPQIYKPVCRNCGRSDCFTREREITEKQYLSLDDFDSEYPYFAVDSEDSDSYSEWLFKCECGVESDDLEDLLADNDDPYEDEEEDY